MRTVLLVKIMAWVCEYHRAFVNTIIGIKAVFLLETQNENRRNNLVLFTSSVHPGATPHSS